MAYTVEELCTDEGLRHTFDYLIPVAHATTTICYGEIATKLASDLGINGKIFPVHVGSVVGTLMERILEIDEDAPLINVLVVRQGRGRASGGSGPCHGGERGPLQSLAREPARGTQTATVRTQYGVTRLMKPATIPDALIRPDGRKADQIVVEIADDQAASIGPGEDRVSSEAMEKHVVNGAPVVGHAIERPWIHASRRSLVNLEKLCRSLRRAACLS